MKIYNMIKKIDDITTDVLFCVLVIFSYLMVFCSVFLICFSTINMSFSINEYCGYFVQFMYIILSVKCLFCCFSELFEEKSNTLERKSDYYER